MPRRGGARDKHYADLRWPTPTRFGGSRPPRGHHVGCRTPAPALRPCLGAAVWWPPPWCPSVAEQIAGTLESELARARQLVLWAPEGNVPGNVPNNVRHFGWRAHFGHVAFATS